MVKTNKKSIGLLGGSFDPAHKGHLIISKIALKKMRLNKVLWLITEKNPFKNKSFYSLTQRIKKAKKIVKQEKKIKVKSLDKIVGSSRKTIFGLCKSAAIISIFIRSPKDRRRTCTFNFSFTSSNSTNSLSV